MVESFEDLNDDNDRDDGGYPAPDDNDDVTNWRGRECGQIVFDYPSMTICVLALLCNFNHNVCIIHHGSLCCTKLCHYPSCQTLTKRKVKNRLLLIITYYWLEVAAFVQSYYL